MRYNSTSKPTNTAKRVEQKRSYIFLIPIIAVVVIAAILVGLFFLIPELREDEYARERAEKAPPEGYTRYSNEALSMSFVLSNSARQLTLQNYDLAYYDNGYYFYVNAMSYQELEEATYNNMPDPWRTDVEGYSRDFIIKNNMSDKQLVYNEDENIAVITSTYIGQEGSYYDHYVIMDNGEAIFLINFNCPAEKEAEFKDVFDMLDDYIYVKKY